MPLGLYLYSQTRRILLLLMTILSQSFFPFVGSHLMSFSFLTAWHKFLLSYFLTLPFTSLTKLLDGLNEGIKCSGILIVTFLEILRAVFSALFFTTKLPKPLKYTFLPSTTEFLIDHKSLHSCLHSYFLNPGRSRNFVNNIRFCHFL